MSKVPTDHAEVWREIARLRDASAAEERRSVTVRADKGYGAGERVLNEARALRIRAYALEELIKTGRYRAVKVRLSRVRLNRGGYDSSGYYYGHDHLRVYSAMIENEPCMEIRARDRDDAKAQVVALWPNATFWR